MVAAAARTWWAAHRRRPRPPTRSATAAGSAGSAARIASFFPLFLAGAMMLCAAVGFTATRLSASHVAAEQHAALQQALDADRVASADVDQFDDASLRLIERRVGLKDLRFEADPAAAGGRELQSVHDARGRIIGWFSWAADGALVAVMDRLWGLLAAVGAALGVGAILGARAWRGLAPSLERSAETKATSQRTLQEALPALQDTLQDTLQDPLTGLPNQRAMLENLDRALARRRSGVVAFAIIDLDGFREVNDTLGRAGGDAVLTNLAEHLQAALPADALFGRFEEDEFAVILSSDDARAPTALTAALRASLQRPIFLDRMWQMTAGIGIAQAPEDGTTGEEVARRAGLALRAAKREGRNCTRAFAPHIESEYAERRFLLRELQTAISLQAFDVHYQPVVAAEGGAIVGVEALLRWNHPTRGAIAPAVFIPLAEQSGLMSQLGEIALRRALADAARWPNLSVAVNLSPLQIRDPWIVDLVGTVMAETGIAASRVVLEVTEGILIDNPQQAQTRLEALRALGVSIALDDFGTGYSSLSYLQRFPFDRLKIDRAFVASLGASGNAGAIVQSIVTLGHALGMKVLAEGVENDAQRVLLRLAGCDEMQGYLFARPAPAAEIDKALARAAGAAVG